MNGAIFVQKDKSLLQIMNEVSRTLDNGYAPAPRVRIDLSKRAPLSEMEAFCRLDPLLADLYKQYLDAKGHRTALVSLNGPNDPMAEIAIDMEDSAWCAYQVRYMELRAQRDKMALAQRLMDEDRREIEDAKKAQERERAETMMQVAMMMDNARAKKKASDNDGLGAWLFFMCLFGLFQAPIAAFAVSPLRPFNRLAA